MDTTSILVRAIQDEKHARFPKTSGSSRTPGKAALLELKILLIIWILET